VFAAPGGTGRQDGSQEECWLGVAGTRSHINPKLQSVFQIFSNLLTFVARLRTGHAERQLRVVA